MKELIGKICYVSFLDGLITAAKVLEVDMPMIKLTFAGATPHWCNVSTIKTISEQAV
jgi:hypothetical protein